jgi:glyoxylase-like metal-dependent hydrolase (beta-lactamase superfamily II)
METTEEKVMKALLSVIAALGMFADSGFAQEPVREVSNIAGDVYLFRNNFHNSVFVITEEGVVVTDPIDAGAAAWLKAEIGKLTDRPITHLVYSHSHGDHASGGAEFGDVPNVIAHANAPEAIDGVAINWRFSSEMQFTAGGKSFELKWLGPGHGTDLAALVIRPENVAFVVDAVASKRLFYRDFPGANVDEWMNQVRKVNRLDFEILAGGHGPVGVKQDVADGLAYLKEMRSAVLRGLKKGKTVDELAESITMDAYAHWLNYAEWRELNVRGMARHLQETGAVE